MGNSSPPVQSVPRLQVVNFDDGMRLKGKAFSTIPYTA